MVKIVAACAIGLLGILGAGDVFAQSSIELRDIQIQVKEMFKKKRYREAVPYAEKALRMSEIEFGSTHPTTAAFVFNLAKLHRLEAQYKEAEPLYKRALEIRQNALGEGHADVAASYNSLGRLYDEQGEHDTAEYFYSRALDVMQVVLSDDPHQENAMSRIARVYRGQAYHNRARLFHEQGSYEDAENLFGAAVVILRSMMGEKHSEVARAYDNYAELLRDMGRPDEAAEKESYAQAIRVRSRK